MSEQASPAVESCPRLLRCLRCIASIDIDCFYAQCEELRHPHLKGKPLGVQQKALVITSNYAARQFGIQKGDSELACRRKCPEITILCGEDLTFYREVSQRVFDVASAMTPNVERLGMDEVYVDLTDFVDEEMEKIVSHDERAGADLTLHGFLYPSASLEADCSALPFTETVQGGLLEFDEATCRMRLAIASRACLELRRRIKHEVGLTASAGLSVNKLLAKLVASANKPDKQTVLLPSATALSTLLPASLPIQRIPGIGFAATQQWNDAGVFTIAQLVAHTGCAGSEALAKLDQRTRDRHRSLCAGVCEEEVRRSRAPRTVGAENSFWRQLSPI
jgi:DNA polymerase iota